MQDKITTLQTQIEGIINSGLTIPDNSITTNKLADYSITQEKLSPDIKIGGLLKVRDLLEGESVINLADISGNKWLYSLFDFSKISASDEKVTDEKDSNKFFSLTTVEPSENGAYALGRNANLIEDTNSFAVGMIFRGDIVNNTGIFRFNGDGNTAINFETGKISFTHSGYYGEIVNPPIDLETFMFLLVGFDTEKDTMDIWINGVKKDSYSLGGRKIGKEGKLNKGYWNDGNNIFNKIAVFNKGSFDDKEVQAISDYIFTVPKYLYVDTSKSFLTLKNGLIRHLTLKNNNGTIKDIVYKDTVRNTTSVNSEGFILSERTLLKPTFTLESSGGCIFIRFDKNSITNQQYLFNYSEEQYLWFNFVSNKLCGRNGSQWIIEEMSVEFSEKNVICFSTDKKVYLNGVYICNLGCNFINAENMIKDLKNEYPIKDYVCYAEPLKDDEINAISSELCSY